MCGSSSSCNVPGYRTTSDELAVKSKQANKIYSRNIPSAFKRRDDRRRIVVDGNEETIEGENRGAAGRRRESAQRIFVFDLRIFVVGSSIYVPKYIHQDPKLGFERRKR
ncbi:hypothetical protein U1Q18_035231 [Sarracenia purpurea var. burkii]